MDLAGEILKQSVIGGVFLALYLKEKADHDKTRTNWIQEIRDRNGDAKEFGEKLIANQSSISQFFEAFATKIKVAKKGGE